MHKLINTVLIAVLSLFVGVSSAFAQACPSEGGVGLNEVRYLPKNVGFIVSRARENILVGRNSGEGGRLPRKTAVCRRRGRASA